MDNKNNVQNQVANSIKGLEANFDDIFVKKAPFQLPDSVKSFIVTVLPWVIIIWFIVLIPALLAVFGLSLFASPFAIYAELTTGYVYSISIIILAIQMVIMLLAIPGLMRKSISGWRYMFYTQLINIVYSIFTLSVSSIISSIIGAIIGLYLLFQIKSYYK